MRTTVLTLFLGSVISLLSAQENRILAIVHKTAITTMDMQEQLFFARQQNASSAELNQAQQLILDRMIAEELLYQEFIERKGVIPESFIQEQLDKYIQNATNGDVAAFEDKLYHESTTMRDFKEKIRKNIAVEVMLKQRIGAGISITDTAIEQYYQAHKAQFIQKPRYHIAVLQLPQNDDAQKKIAEINQALGSGMTFTDVVKKYSAGANAENGGDQGWLSEMAPGLLEAVKNMEPNSITPLPIALGSNLYFIKLVDVEKGKTNPLNHELKEAIKEILEGEERVRKLDETIANLKMKYVVLRFDNPAPEAK